MRWALVVFDLAAKEGDMVTTEQPPHVWAAARSLDAVRAWAKRVITGSWGGKRIPNAVTIFCERHRIPLDDSVLAARAILTRLNAIEAAKDTAP